MKIRTWSYLVRQAFRSLNRNVWLGLASAGTVTISLIIVGISMIVVMNTNSLASRLEANVEIISYLKDTVSVSEAVEIKKQIEAIPGVSSVQFVTKDEALKQFRQQLGDQQNMLDALGGTNPLPNLYKITTVSPEDVPKIAAGIQAMPTMEKVDYGKGVVEKLFNITKWVRLVGIIVITFLGVAAIFLIATTIRLTVFARRKEIQIMKVLGATNWFIRLPFVLEGIVLGFSGALMASFIVWGIYIAFTNYVINNLNFSVLGLQTDMTLMIYLVVLMLGFGTFLGALGSGISIRKYLKV